MNKYFRIANRSLIIMLLIAASGFIIPAILGIDGMNGGFALGFIGFFVFIMAWVVFFMYCSIGKKMKKAMQAGSLLGEWTLNGPLVSDFNEYDFKDRASNLKMTRWLIIGVTIIVTPIILLIGIPLDFTIIFVLSLSTFIFIVSLIARQAAKKKLKRNEIRIKIAQTGIILNDDFHVFEGMGNKIEKVSFSRTEKNLLVLSIEYSSVSKNGRNSHEVNIPVPPEQEKNAEKIAAYFYGKIQS